MKTIKTSFNVKIFHCLKRNKTMFRLLEDERFEFDGGSYIIVPKGFETDFASVPRWLWSVLSPVGKVNGASLVHDYLYDNKDKHGRTRKQVDMTFLNMLIESKVSKFQSYLMYYGVRLGGRRWWLN